MDDTIRCDKTVSILGGELKMYRHIPQHDLDFMLKVIEDEMLDDELMVIGEGNFGTVYGYKEYAIKYSNRHPAWIDEDELEEPEDALILKEIQHLDYVPRLYATIGKDCMIVSKVEGVTVKEFLCDRREGKSTYFINPKFNYAFKEMLKDLVQLGFDPNDLHAKNVMIDSETGMPVLVDVGFFEKNDSFYRRYSNDREAIPFSISSLYNAVDWICEKTGRYIEEDAEEEMKEQFESIHNPAEIGEMLMNFKEQPAIQFDAGGINFIGQGEEILWNAHEMRIKRVASAYKKGVAIMGKQQNLDAIKAGGGIGIDFGKLRASGEEVLKLYVAKNRYKHPNPDAGVVPPMPLLIDGHIHNIEPIR